MAKSFMDNQDKKQFLVKEWMHKAERTDVVRSLISALEDQIYPPEEAFRYEFVKRVERASKSKGKIFKNVKELEVHLKSLSR